MLINFSHTLCSLFCLTMTIWQCRPWFGSTWVWFRMIRCATVQFGTSHVNLRWPHICKHQI
jgi:hypothetical protein